MLFKKDNILHRCVVCIGFSLTTMVILFLSGCGKKSEDGPSKSSTTAPGGMTKSKRGGYDLTRHSEDLRSIVKGLENLIIIGGRTRRTLPVDKKDEIATLQKSTDQARILKITAVFNDLVIWMNDLNKDQISHLAQATSDVEALINEVREACKPFDAELVKQIIGLTDAIEEVNTTVQSSLPNS